MKNTLTANRLNEALSEANMTAQELANKSGVSKHSISQYRNGAYKPSNISSGLMGEILGVNPLWLMGFDVPKELPDNGVLKTGQNSEYYEDAKLAQEMFEDPDMRSLFHMKKNMDKDRFQAHMRMMKDLYRLEHPEEEDFY